MFKEGDGQHWFITLTAECADHFDNWCTSKIVQFPQKWMDTTWQWWTLQVGEEFLEDTVTRPILVHRGGDGVQVGLVPPLVTMIENETAERFPQLTTNIDLDGRRATATMTMTVSTTMNKLIRFTKRQRSKSVLFYTTC